MFVSGMLLHALECRYDGPIPPADPAAAPAPAVHLLTRLLRDSRAELAQARRSTVPGTPRLDGLVRDIGAYRNGLIDGAAGQPPHPGA